MRDLLRTRKQMMRERSSHIQRIQKTLEDANIKLDSVVTDILASVAAASQGLDRRSDHAAALPRCTPAHPRLGRRTGGGLRGRVTKHHRFLLKLHLDQIDAFDAAIAASTRSEC